MNDEHPFNSLPIHDDANQHPFTAHTSIDPVLKTTVLSLLSNDRENPSKSIIVSIAPELGSNMFRFRVGTNDIIYCDAELLTKADFTGNFVLWPLPNRVRDKRYVYQGNS